MMAVMALREKERQADQMVKEHHELAKEILECLRGVGKTAKPRISLFIDKAGENGETDTGRV